MSGLQSATARLKNTERVIIWRLPAATWFCALLLAGMLLLSAPAQAVSLTSSTRAINIGESAMSRTSPGAFVNTVSSSNSSGSRLASQDSTISLNATLIRIFGNASTAAEQTVATATSQLFSAESSLEVTFSPLNDSPFLLSGLLTLEDSVPLGGSPRFDNSMASVQLAELSGPTLFSFNSNGSFNHTGVLTAGRTYHLRIDSDLSLQTREIFDKTNGWKIDFIASDVPEPDTILLAVLCFIAFSSAPQRRADGLRRTRL